MTPALLKFRGYLLSGVSYAIPFIACGGILIAAAIMFAPMTPEGPDLKSNAAVKLVFEIGSAAFSLMLPVLAGYIAYAMANKPGLVPGFIGGYLAGQINAGFLGALAAGLLAGWVVNGIKRLPVPKMLRPVMPILILPILSSLVVGGLMLLVLGPPIAGLMKNLAGWLENMGHGNALLLAMVLGGMIAFDMGGPVNKVAFFFGAAMIKEGNFQVMGAVAAAICTPPLGLGLATLLWRDRWSEEEREAGMAALAMGFIGITEGAISFAAANPLRVIPCAMGGSMLAAMAAMAMGVGGHAPHGGPIVLPVTDHKLAYAAAILCGTLATALAVMVTRQRKPEANPPAS